jgi:diacylglycerol kinase
MEKIPEKRRFSMIARIRSSNNAFRGFLIVLKTTPNFLLQLVVGALAVWLGVLLQISATEWMILVFTIGLVLFAEIINTAIEIDIDLTSPEFHPYARDTKDVAAAAVLFTVFLACLVGIIIFLPKILELYF